jgi:HD-like signal output (HDOD) protein
VKLLRKIARFVARPALCLSNSKNDNGFGALMREKILKLLEETEEKLPPFPAVLQRLDKLLKSPDVAITDLARLIETETIISGKLLKLANSAYYNTGFMEVTTLPIAVSRLGFRVVQQLVQSLILTQLFQENKLIDHRLFWRHSLAVAKSAKTVNLKVGASESEQEKAYLVGLMHDVGIMVFVLLIPQEYSELLKKCPETEKPLDIMEREEFGLDHPELGGMFLEHKWKLDKSIAESVKIHHLPFETFDEEMKCGQLVNLANTICNNQGIFNGIDCYTEIFKEIDWMQLGLTLSDAEEILNGAEIAMLEAETLLSA